MEKQARLARKEMEQYKQERARDRIPPPPPPLNSSQSVDAALNIEAELGIAQLLFHETLRYQQRILVTLRILCPEHKVQRVPHCISPRWNWDSPNPSLASECGGEGTLACV
jgi:hypothetical protein